MTTYTRSNKGLRQVGVDVEKALFIINVSPVGSAKLTARSSFYIR